jgi:hypothetical protein
VNIDAAGTIVMNHGIYYMENLAGGEPLLYKCLKVRLRNYLIMKTSSFFLCACYYKTKNTFAYVHGLGTFVYQSYPEYERQGANLTTEIIFRIVKKVLQIRGLKTFRNLYMHLDNYSVNKNFTIISALGAMAVLGFVHKCIIPHYFMNIIFKGINRKTKISYGKRGHGHCDNDANMGKEAFLWGTYVNSVIQDWQRQTLLDVQCSRSKFLSHSSKKRFQIE